MATLRGLKGDFTRGHLIGYATVAGLALVPAIWLAAIGLPIVNGTYPFVTLALVLFLILCSLRPLQLVLRRHPTPTLQLFADVKAHWPWLATSLFMAIALPQTLDASTAIKRHIPDFNPYYADAALIRLDAVFGIDPWKVTHRLFGPVATRTIDLVYVSWHFVQIGLATWLVLARNREFQLRAALSFQVAWLVMGGFMAVSFASVGPCFVDDFFGNGYYAPLMAQLPPDLFAVRAMTYLLETEGSDAVGGGISAMPSLHIAVAVLAALCIRDRFPRWQWPAWAYVAIIYVGSIHLGWHYASDGIVSGAGMIAIWKAAGWYVERLRGARWSTPVTA